jgi:hypothetical protein
VFSGCASFRVSVLVLLLLYLCRSIYIHALWCWLLGFFHYRCGVHGVVSGDGISSTLTISDGCCSPSSNCTRDLVLTLGCLALWLASACFGGAMVVNVECLLSLNGLCDLCELRSVLLSLYRSLSVLFSQMDSFLPRPCVVWAYMKLVEDATLIMGSMHLWSLSYFPLLCLAISSWCD